MHKAEWLRAYAQEKKLMKGFKAMWSSLNFIPKALETWEISQGLTNFILRNSVFVGGVNT